MALLETIRQQTDTFWAKFIFGAVVLVFVDVVVGGGVMVGMGSSQSPQSVQSVPTAQNSGSSQTPSLAYSHVSLRPATDVLVNVVVLVESPYLSLPRVIGRWNESS